MRLRVDRAEPGRGCTLNILARVFIVAPPITVTNMKIAAHLVSNTPILAFKVVPKRELLSGY
jgi:hypothetical protein